jgi:hypothetical protein
MYLHIFTNEPRTRHAIIQSKSSSKKNAKDILKRRIKNLQSRHGDRYPDTTREESAQYEMDELITHKCLDLTASSHQEVVIYRALSR